MENADLGSENAKMKREKAAARPTTCNICAESSRKIVVGSDAVTGLSYHTR